ncbi:uncharacterized protein AMSG_07288 [Thecamonas trahens ATCC 50062]|uniref:Glycerophosphocholine acyltransferase 1 n=1 Tax=Thecamonas trahens ATCC 50062 TaxID=461836 RepID=A0A0L0DIY4_THETB|nr:transmembrane protein [Thecamonas trahens ATCC 50062]KNC51283.1 transmembrane protein [Thecamonas trahens ATCC 50062]|eukprot:XP_013756209.1 transmembrane protein [Thecamonas trahens ATCC 50062]
MADRGDDRGGRQKGGGWGGDVGGSPERVGEGSPGSEGMEHEDLLTRLLDKLTAEGNESAGSRAKVAARIKEMWASKGKPFISDKVARVNDRVARGRGAWRKVVTGKEDVRIRDHIRERIRTPKAVRMKDKLSFLLGILVGIILTEYVMILYPVLFGAWFALIMPALCVARYVMYAKLNWHLFLMDFCYVVQALCLISVWTPASATEWHAAIFTLANGPLLWAIPTWRCSMVFHSLDKVTSVFIHAFPAMLTFTLHWYPAVPEGVSLATAATTQWAEYNTMASHFHAPISFVGWFVMPMAIYLVWQVLYYYKTEVRDRSKFEADKTLTTSLRWLSADDKNPMHKLVLSLLRRIGVMGPTEKFDASTVKTKVIFMATQFVYTVITILPIPIIYSSVHLHIALLVALLGVSLWNGANFYFDVFSRRYEAKFADGRHNVSSAIGIDPPAVLAGSPPASPVTPVSPSLPKRD